MKGELLLVDNISELDKEFELGVSLQDFCLNIYVDSEKTFEKQLKNKKEFDQNMKFIEEFFELEDEDNTEHLKVRNYIIEHFDNILDSVEYIRLYFEKTDNLEFIKKNPLVLTKKIVLNEMLNINDYDRLIELMTKYQDIIDKVYISMIGNVNYVSLLDCYKTMNAIKEQAEGIKRLGLSPMETIMYVYDQVRSRVYTFEDKDESVHKSRDLSEVIFGDKIVCAGYANIFSTILYYLGIDSYVVHVVEKDNPESAHARNVIYVKDYKYDIDGVYYFDSTWDSRRKNETNEYLYRYTYFAKTRKFMDDDKQFDFEDSYFQIYSIDMDKEIKKIIAEGQYDKLVPYVKSLNYMSRLVTDTKLIDVMNVISGSPIYGEFDKDEFLRKFEEVFSKFNKELPAEVMVKLLNNVRKLEYYQKPELYPYTPTDIYNTFRISNWQFSDKHLSQRERIMKAIFGEEPDIDSRENFKNYGHENEIFKDISQVTLTKTLRRIYENKNK